jgi:L-asparagine oxygenase
MVNTAHTTTPPAGTGSLEPDEVVDLDSAQRLYEAAAELARQVHWSKAQEQAEAAVVLASRLPADLLRALHRFAAAGSVHNALLVRGLLPPPSLPPSPGTATPTDLDVSAIAASLVLLAVMSRLGQPFTFASLYGGRLVQHVTPARGQEQAQTSEGSDTFLDWHVEDAFTDDRCDLFGLYCLRGDPTAATLFTPTRQARLDPRWIEVLGEPRFVVRADVAHGDQSTPAGPPVPVLTGPDDDPEIRFDAVYLAPAHRWDLVAAQALEQLGQALTAAAVGHVLTPGELLILDNRRVVHARTGFRPRFDGTDRWLMRVMVCACGREHRRRGGRRAIR